MKKKILTFLFLLLCIPFFSQSFLRTEFFFVTEHFSLLIFPVEEELLLFFRNGEKPLKNTKICLYKDGHITKPQVTGKDGILRISRPEEPFVQFRVGSYRAIHTFTLPEIEPKKKCNLEAVCENDSVLIKGNIPEYKGTIRLVYRDGADILEMKEIEAEGVFVQKFPRVNHPVFVELYAQDNFLCSALINTSSLPVIVWTPEKIKTCIPQKLELTPEMQLDCQNLGTLESVLLAFSRCGEPAEKLYFSNGSKIFDLQPAMNDGILAGNVEVITGNGNSVKENFCLPVLPLRREFGKFRCYKTEGKVFAFFAQESWKEAFLVFYTGRIRHTRIISVEKGVNRIELPPELLKEPCISAGIFCTEEASGSSAGLFCQFMQKKAFSYEDIAEIPTSLTFLTQKQENGKNGLNFYCRLGAVTDDTTSVYGELSIRNLQQRERQIHLQTVLQEDAVREDLLGSNVVLGPEEELQIRFDLPLEQEKEYTRNMLITEVTPEEEAAVFWLPSQRVARTQVYYETFAVSGRLIENRTSEIPVVLPEGGAPIVLDCCLSTDRSAFSQVPGLLTEYCASEVFEEAMLDYLQKIRLSDNSSSLYPYFLWRFWGEHRLIRRFAFASEEDLDASLLYLYAASCVPELAIPGKVAAVTSYFRSHSELLANNRLRQELFYRSVKETQKITSKNIDMLYSGTPVEHWLFADGAANPPESTLAKIIQLLPDNQLERNPVSFTLSQSFSPAEKNEGRIFGGQTAANRITLPENYISMTEKREIRYQIGKEGAADLFYQINGRFYSNQLGGEGRFLRISLTDRDDMPLQPGSRLKKNTVYTARIYLPDELKKRPCVLLLKDRIVSAVQEIRLSDGRVWETGRPVFFSGNDLVFSFQPDISFHFDDLCFAIFPLVSGSPWLHCPEVSEEN